MKITILIAFIFACCALVSAYPASVFGEESDSLIQNQQELVRVKRVTCDVLSFEAKGIKLNDAACASHCLFKGRRGGYCNGRKVCVCRN